MSGDKAIRATVALAIAVLGGGAALVIGADPGAMLVAMVGAIAAVLIALGTESEDTPAPPPPAAAPIATNAAPPVAEIIEAVIEPVLVIADRRIIHANGPARALLGQHILGEDVRLAIRHPAAAERLTNEAAGDAAEPIHLVGLGAREQRWEMHVRKAGPTLRIVHLIDRSGNYAADRIRVDFVANASHELRTPLASILGFIETLREGAGDDPETRERFLRIMFGEATRMRRLVDDLMSLSRIEAEKYREPDQVVHLGELIEEVRTEIASTHHGRADDLVTQVMDVATVKGDRAQLSQLLHNLIGNAMKYGRPGTPVSVELRHDGGAMLRLAVRDEGDGIAQEHLPRLTERFYRVDSGRSRAAGGTGLGLSIVKHIVERHRGRLEIASQVGIGTTVSILLPASVAP